jgi:hypothetical protein
MQYRLQKIAGDAGNFLQPIFSELVMLQELRAVAAGRKRPLRRKQPRHCETPVMLSDA